MTKHSEATSAFDQFFTRFRKTDLWWYMVNTREDSHWHREPNVGDHTRMLIDWYMSNCSSKRSDEQQVWSLIACLFHDVGKPAVEQHRFTEARGDHKIYHGHEQVSARMWEEYALAHQDDPLLSHLTMNEVGLIAFMIEHHVPFLIVKKRKKLALKQTLHQLGGVRAERAWLDLLLADQHGRISDNHAANLAIIEQWLIKWETT